MSEGADQAFALGAATFTMPERTQLNAELF